MIGGTGGDQMEKLARAAVEAAFAHGGTEGLEGALKSLPGLERIEPLSSKRSTCFRLFAEGRELFVKALDSEHEAEDELRNCAMLVSHGIDCPAVIAQKGRFIARGFMEGTDASSALDSLREAGDIEGARDLTAKIGQVIGQIHSIERKPGLNIVLNDLNLGNFILRPDGAVAVIDLSEAGRGDWARDIGALVVHILTHKPEFAADSWMMADAAMRGYIDELGTAFEGDRFSKGLEAALYDAVSRRRDPLLMNRVAGLLEWSSGKFSGEGETR